MSLNDANALNNMGTFYGKGEYGLPQNYAKALELWHKAGELGYTNAYYKIANAHYFGRGMKIDKKKAIHYYELAAKGGHEMARHNLGAFEEQEGNHHRALKHFNIAVEDGERNSLKAIKELYMDGLATKEDYAKALRAYQAYLDEIKSEQRDEAAAVDDEYKYYESTF